MRNLYERNVTFQKTPGQKTLPTKIKRTILIRQRFRFLSEVEYFALLYQLKSLFVALQVDVRFRRPASL